MTQRRFTPDAYRRAGRPELSGPALQVSGPAFQVPNLLDHIAYSVHAREDHGIVVDLPTAAARNRMRGQLLVGVAFREAAGGQTEMVAVTDDPRIAKAILRFVQKVDQRTGSEGLPGEGPHKEGRVVRFQVPATGAEAVKEFAKAVDRVVGALEQRTVGSRDPVAVRRPLASPAITAERVTGLRRRNVSPGLN